MNNTITGRVICAGRLKDNNGDEFHGLMIECELENVAVPFYQDVIIREVLAENDDLKEDLHNRIVESFLP